MTPVEDRPRQAGATRADAHRSRSRLAGEDGSFLALSATGIVVTVVALVVALDVSAYLLAASRAQGAADAAALAAAQVADPRGLHVGDPRAEAVRVAAANGGRLLHCACRTGPQGVSVTVRVPVPALVVDRLFPREVVATSAAELVPPRPVEEWHERLDRRR